MSGFSETSAAVVAELQQGMQPNAGTVAPNPDPVPVRADVLTRFKPGNRAALKHGMYAKNPEAVLVTDLNAESLDAFEAAIVVDLGGASELATIKRSYVSKLRTLEALCQLAELDLWKNGYSKKTETQVRQSIETWDRVASRLGVERQQKRVRTPLEALQED